MANKSWVVFLQTPNNDALIVFYHSKNDVLLIIVIFCHASNQDKTNDLPSVIRITASSRLPSVSARTVNRSSSFHSGNSSRKVDNSPEYLDFNFFVSSSRALDDCDEWDGVERLGLFVEEDKEEPDFGFGGLCESVDEDIVLGCVGEL